MRKQTELETQADRVKRMIESEYDCGDLETNLASVLTDIRHLCDQERLDFHRLETKSYHFYAEDQKGSTP